MIERLTIRNFQAHGKIKIDLAHPITTIIGKTDAGKSAVLRALRWVMQNKPDGKEFIKNGTTKATVSLVVDGKTITRVRSKTGNEYTLDEESFKAFRNSVPEEIAALCAVSDFNFQSQYDKPFWFDEKGGEINKQLNAVVDLSSMDEARTRATQFVRKTASELENARAQKASARNKLRALKSVPSLVRLLKKAEVTETRLQNRVSESLSLQKAIEDTQKHEKRARTAVLQRSCAIAMQSVADDLEETRKEVKNLRNLLQKAEEANSVPQTSAKWGGKLEEVAHELENLRRVIENAEVAVGHAKKAEQRLQAHKRESARARKEVAAFEAKIHKQLKGKCPLCGRK